MTPREHVQQIWQQKAAEHDHESKHAVKKALHHSLLAESHRKMSKACEENGDDENSSFHRGMAGHHKDMSEHHSDEAGYHKDEAKKCQGMAKAVEEGPATKAAGLTEDDLNKIAPDAVYGVIPSNVPGYGVRAVPRVGQPQELVNSRDVPVELQKFIETDIF